MRLSITNELLRAKNVDPRLRTTFSYKSKGFTMTVTNLMDLKQKISPLL